MLKWLSLKNFRGFPDHRVEFEKETILIGKNNAGKTTVIEALRVLSVCQTRALTATYIPTPEWLGENCAGAGFRVSLERIDFDFTNVQHAYDTSEPAIIRAKLSSNAEVTIFIGRSGEQVFCQLRRHANNIVHERRGVLSGVFGSTKVMPPVGSLLPREKAIAKDRLLRYMDGYLAYRHFRNQLWERIPDYRTFKGLIENTWQNLQIQHFENDHGTERNEFSLLIREGRFTSEISWHGHGLQAWAQTIWFLSRTDRSATIVLDEPDVYLHADLQRKLIKVIESLGFRQSILAAHSPEIISDVPFKSVVVVQKRERTSKPAAKATEIQSSLRGMGSIHSIQLSKIAEKGIVLFVEGDDKAFLFDVAFKMGAKIFDNFADLAIHEIKGKGNWQQALGAANALKQASGGDVEAALLLDNDYMLDPERMDFQEKAFEAGLMLKIWERKEIENYFIIPSAIARYVTARSSLNVAVDEDEVLRTLDDVEREVEEDLTLSYSDSIKMSSKNLSPKSCFLQAKELIQTKISNGAKISHLACGKSVISKMSDRFKRSHNVSFNALSLCKESNLTEIAMEIPLFITGICARRKSQ